MEMFYRLAAVVVVVVGVVGVVGVVDVVGVVGVVGVGEIKLPAWAGDIYVNPSRDEFSDLSGSFVSKAERGLQ